MKCAAINLVCCCETLVLSDSAEGKKDWRVNRLQYSPRLWQFIKPHVLYLFCPCPGEVSEAKFSFEVSPGACFFLEKLHSVHLKMVWIRVGWIFVVCLLFELVDFDRTKSLGFVDFFKCLKLRFICCWKRDLIFIVDSLLQLNMCITSHLGTVEHSVHLQEPQFFSFHSLLFFYTWKLLCSLILPSCGSSFFSCCLSIKQVVTLGSKP